MATGEKAGTWGTLTNTNWNIIEQISGGYTTQAVTDGADTDLSVSDGSAGLEKAFGALPLTETDNILDMQFEEGCILDSIVLGEELGDTELRILPFEAGSYPNQTSPPVVSGRDYFTELPMRYPTAGRTNDFSSFASSFSSSAMLARAIGPPLIEQRPTTWARFWG